MSEVRLKDSRNEACVAVGFRDSLVSGYHNSYMRVITNSFDLNVIIIESKGEDCPG